MRYIGGKRLLIDRIESTIRECAPDAVSVLDLFSGSGAVSVGLKKAGYRVLSNDYLYFSYILQKCSMELDHRPRFKKLGIRDPIAYLNALTPEQTGIAQEDCFVYNQFSPVNGCERMYFQPQNALKIDLIRKTIGRWRDEDLISEAEFAYLLASLLNAVPSVANIAGVFAAYLKYWENRTYNPLILRAPELVRNGRRCRSFNCDYTKMLSRRCDLLYADPPYNAREYLPNYHVLETIARYDSPVLHGLTGMREYEEQKSPFCKKKTVHQAFETMLRRTKCRYLLISYNNEGLISTEELSELCKKYAVPGSFRLMEFDYRRYKNKIPNDTAGLKEQLYFLEKK